MSSPQAISDGNESSNENNGTAKEKEEGNQLTDPIATNSANSTHSIPESSRGEKMDESVSDSTPMSPAPPLSPAAASSKQSSTPVSSTTATTKGQTTTFDEPNKITLKFIFANRDGLHVILDCKPTDTVGEVKGALLSMWPEDVPECSGGDRMRLICMGKGILMPDTKTLEAAEVPIFKTHPTPVNVSVKPELGEDGKNKGSPKKIAGGTGGSRGGGTSGGAGGSGGASNADGNGVARGSGTTSSGCSCVIS